MVRPVNAISNGTYDEGGNQQGSRDAEAGSSALGCP
jgi:hypothetical protein